MGEGLPPPADAASAETGAVACPFCGSRDTALVGAWGGTLLTRQHRCAACRTYFEAIREPGPAFPEPS